MSHENTASVPDTTAAKKTLDAAAADGRISPSAVENIRAWLVEPRYVEYRPQVVEHLTQGKFAQLNDAFWEIIPFGTGGRRGRMYPIGSAVMNERTVGESAQGLADYFRGCLGGHHEVVGPSTAGAVPQAPNVVPQVPRAAPLACAIAHDTRHRSRDFARLSAEILAAAGYTVYFLEGFRSTPELSFTVRYKQCSCGIMITASHNPPSDNGFKAYGPSGGQLVPPDDKGVIRRVMAVDLIRRTPFDKAVAAGAIVVCQQEIDAAFQRAVVEQSLPGPRELKVIYSPLHGVGSSAVLPVLAAVGFAGVEEFAPQAEPNGDFPNVPGHVSNPENPAVFDSMIARGQKIRADLAIATDPDCDRLGCAAPVGSDPAGPWETFTGNQLGALLVDFVLASHQAAGTLTSEHYVVKTLVTTELIRRIADAYGVRSLGNLQVGFKWIGQLMDEAGPDKFVLGTEESHGYLVGQYARDKDGVVASMLLAELAAVAKAAGETLHQRLDGLFRRFGCHAEKTISLTMPGEQGMEDMKKLMARFRESPPAVLADLRVEGWRDYLGLTQTFGGGPLTPLPFREGPREGQSEPAVTPLPFREGPGEGQSESRARDENSTAPSEDRGAGRDRPSPGLSPEGRGVGTQPLAGPRGDMVMFDLSSEGNYVAVRPSGTEPKVKFYMFTYHPPEDGADLAAIKKMLADRLAHLEHDLRGFAAISP